MMECAERTEADKKGGQLAVRAADGQLILRESAQCAKEDEPAFQVRVVWINLGRVLVSSFVNKVGLCL